MSKVRVEVKIHGRVQGVFYRQSTVGAAQDLGLTGWVKNCPDGCVAAVFEGERAAVEQALEWCRQGPPAAVVSNVEEKWLDFEDEFSSFGVRY